MNDLNSISPLDGRYKAKVKELSEFVSEFALIKARVGIEIKYLIALSKIGVVRKLGNKEIKLLESLHKNFDIKDAEKVKLIESKINHDVKAVEVYLREILGKTSLADLTEFIHFGLTSEDINNLAYRIMLRSASENIIIPTLEKLLKSLFQCSQEHQNKPMLARTHGQPAVPTTLGKEIAVFASRLSSQLNILKRTKLTGKLNGAVGNYNALHFAYPKIDWIKFSKNFVSSFGFEFSLATTQINPSEDIIELFQAIQRINGIILDLNQDFWRYISDGWFVLKSAEDEVGSSTMPQKINPIDFENSEGNLKLANGMIEVFARELPISRLQRDLSNSTIIRNIGTVLGYCLLAYKNTLYGTSILQSNEVKMLQDLNSDWSILSEALQTVLRLEKVNDSYSKVLEKTKGKHLTEQDWKGLVQELTISKENKEKLLNLSPATYLGLASKIASEAV